MSISSSPSLLSNSAFSSLNLFSSPPVIPHRQSSHSPSSSPRPRSRASRPRQPPSIPTRHSSIFTEPEAHHSALSTPDLSYYLDSPSFFPSATHVQSASSRPDTPTPATKAIVNLDSPSSSLKRISFRSSIMSVKSFSVVDLGSPCVISGDLDAEAKRGSVHVGKERLVNWARPFMGNEKTPDVQVFGQSSQRNRRIKKSYNTDSIDLASHSPSSSSSDDGSMPSTPSAFDMAPSQSWSAKPDLEGLGIKDFGFFQSSVFESDLPCIAEGLHLAEINTDSRVSSPIPVELNSPIISSPGLPQPQTMAFRRRTTTPPRLLTSTQSFFSLASPNNLAELRQLQQAAVDMEFEAKRRYKLNIPEKKENRIRRKAVPVAPFEDLPSCSSQASSSTSPQIFTLSVAPTSEMSRSTSGTSSMSSVEEIISVVAVPSVAISVTPPHTPVLREAPESSMRRFYSNARATMSMIDVSPRSAPLPSFVQPRGLPKSNAHSRSASAPVDQSSPTTSAISTRKPSSDASSDSGESFDQPLTPNSFNSGLGGKVGGNGFHFAHLAPVKEKKVGAGIYGNKTAFLSQLDLGLKRVMDRKGDNEVEGKKQKKGLGRFLGIKA